VLDKSVHVVTVSRNGVLGKIVEVRLVKHIPLVLQRQNEDLPGRQSATAGTDLDFVEPLAYSVCEQEQEQSVPPFCHTVVVSRRAGHDWADGGRGRILSWPFRLAGGNKYKSGTTAGKVVRSRAGKSNHSGVYLSPFFLAICLMYQRSKTTPPSKISRKSTNRRGGLIPTQVI
jgi:hypothetical protein